MACLIALLAGLLISCGEKEEQVVEEVIRPVKVLTVVARGGGSDLQFPGEVRADKRVELAFKEVGGRLIELPIEGREGEQVEKGELLARIDPKDFETDIRNVQGRLKEAQAGLELAKSEYARVKRVQDQDPGAVSAADVDRKRGAVNAAEGRIRSLKAEVDDARNQLSYTNLNAPFTGLIARRFVDNFQDVKPKQPILALEDISNVELLIDVPENVMAISREREGSIKMVAEFPTEPGKQYPLKVKEFATKADPATQTYQVVLQMPQPEGMNVLPGMTATVSVSLPKQQSAVERSIFIPAIAVMTDPDGNNYVWVVDSENMTVNKKDVKIGRLSGSENIDVLEGLEGGEKLVVAGVKALQEGMRVSFWEQK